MAEKERAKKQICVLPGTSCDSEWLEYKAWGKDWEAGKSRHFHKSALCNTYRSGNDTYT
jgi:hypothetical protein